MGAQRRISNKARWDCRVLVDCAECRCGASFRGPAGIRRGGGDLVRAASCVSNTQGSEGRSPQIPGVGSIRDRAGSMQSRRGQLRTANFRRVYLSANMSRSRAAAAKARFGGSQAHAAHDELGGHNGRAGPVPERRFYRAEAASKKEENRTRYRTGGSLQNPPDRSSTPAAAADASTLPIRGVQSARERRARGPRRPPLQRSSLLRGTELRKSFPGTCLMDSTPWPIPRLRPRAERSPQEPGTPPHSPGHGQRQRGTRGLPTLYQRRMRPKYLRVRLGRCFLAQAGHHRLSTAKPGDGA